MKDYKLINLEYHDTKEKKILEKKKIEKSKKEIEKENERLLKLEKGMVVPKNMIHLYKKYKNAKIE
jgi:hypothetical protein